MSAARRLFPNSSVVFFPGGSWRSHIFRQQRPEWTLHAARSARTAIGLSCMDDQGVKFIVQTCVRWELTLKQCLNVVITAVLVGECMAFEHSSCISIDHENRMATRVEKNRIRGLRSDSVDPEKLLTQFGRRCPKHFCERPAIFFADKVHEGLKFSGFLPKIA